MSFTESLEELIAANENGLLGIHPTWTRVRLADVCSVLNGFAFSSKKFKTQGGVPLMRIRDVIRGWTETHFDGEYDEQYLVEHGELVVGMDGDFNCALWAGRTALLNQRVCKLAPDEQFYDVRLLVHAIKGYLSAINSKTSAITVKHLSSRTVADIPLPLPPKPEQGRLVEAIESYFTRLDDAVANLKRVKRNLKRYRASVLKSAVEGRLVPTEAALARAEGRDYEPASALLERILTERRRRWEEAELEKMEAKGKPPKNDKWKAKYKEPLRPETTSDRTLPEGWAWASIDQLAIVGTGATPKRGNSRYWKDGSIPWVTSSVVNDHTVTAPSELVTPEALAETNLTLYPAGTVLVAMYGEGKTRGRATVLEIESSTNQALAALVLPGSCAVQRDWILEFLEHNYMEIRRVAAGGVQPNLNLSLVRSICVPIPPVAEQARIKAEADKSLTIALSAEDVASRCEQRVTRLRQSILKLAFEGGLVDQEATEECASELLRRVSVARRASTSTETKSRKRQKAKARKA